jgi:hypothetical protein
MIRTIRKAISIACIASLATAVVYAEDTSARSGGENVVSAVQLTPDSTDLHFPVPSAAWIAPDSAAPLLRPAATPDSAQSTLARSSRLATAASNRSHKGLKKALISAAVVAGVVGAAIAAGKASHSTASTPTGPPQMVRVY